MFDANMRHLPVGHKGFARVCGTKTGGLWEKLGIIEGSLVYFTTNKTGDWDNFEEDCKANVTVHLDTGDVVVYAYAEDKYYSRMTYEGSLYPEKSNLLSGFISTKSLKEAVGIMQKSGEPFIVGKNPNAKDWR